VLNDLIGLFRLNVTASDVFFEKGSFLLTPTCCFSAGIADVRLTAAVAAVDSQIIQIHKFGFG
jgi:hypothetical protein